MSTLVHSFSEQQNALFKKPQNPHSLLHHPHPHIPILLLPLDPIKPECRRPGPGSHPMATAIPLNPLHQRHQQRHPADDRPLVRLAKRQELQHHPDPAGEPRIRPGMEQRDIVHIHVRLDPRVPGFGRAGGHPQTKLA